MQYLPFSDRHWAGGPMTLRPGPARAHRRMAALMGVVALLTGINQLGAQFRTGTTSLVLQVRPEEQLQVQNGSVVLKIRLARGTMARLWLAESCTPTSPQSQVIIASGNYTIPLNLLIPASGIPTPHAMQVCLVSSDGVLNDSRPVETLGTAVQGGRPSLRPKVFRLPCRMDGA